MLFYTMNIVFLFLFPGLYLQVKPPDYLKNLLIFYIILLILVITNVHVASD